MAQASKDQNNVSTLLGALNTNGTTPIRVLASPTTHAIMADDGTTGDDHGPVDAPRDENFIPVLLAVSSADGVTPVVVYADADGKLLIDSS